jgi:hypothetical protein
LYGLSEKDRFHGEFSQNAHHHLRKPSKPSRFPSQGCPSDPRCCAGHTMSWNGAAAMLSSSACGIGDCITQDPISGGRRRNFDCFEDQNMQGSLPQTFPGNIATMSWHGDAATQSSRACWIGGMITHDLISGARKRDFDVFADQRVQGSSPQTFPGNSANQNGGGAASMGHSANKNGGGPASMAAVSIPGSPASVPAAGQLQPKVPESKRPRGFIAKLPEKGSAKYSDMLARIVRSSHRSFQLRSSHRSFQRTVGARGAPRCSGIRMLFPPKLKKTGRRQAVHPHCKILKMQKSALAF